MILHDEFDTVMLQILWGWYITSYEQNFCCSFASEIWCGNLCYSQQFSLLCL